jgi:hypothetical protein
MRMFNDFEVDVPPDAVRVTYAVAIALEGGKHSACVAEVTGQHYR